VESEDGEDFGFGFEYSETLSYLTMSLKHCYKT